MFNFKEVIRKGIHTNWMNGPANLAGMIKQSQPECFGSLLGFSQALLLILIYGASSSHIASAAEQSDAVATERLVAGLDAAVARDAFEVSADNKEIIQLGQGNDRFLARFRQPPSAYSMAVLALVARDSDLLDDNLATEFQEELAINGWAVLLISLGYKEESAGSTAVSDAGKLSEGIQFLKQRNTASLLLLADEQTKDAAIKAATQHADMVNIMVLNNVALDHMPDEKVMAALLDSRISILDVVTNEFDKSVLRERRQWFAKSGFEDGYRLMSAPPSAAGNTYIVKRTRAWLNKGFRAN